MQSAAEVTSLLWNLDWNTFVWALLDCTFDFLEKDFFVCVPCVFPAMESQTACCEIHSTN